MAHGAELERLYRTKLGEHADTPEGLKILVMVRAMCWEDQSGPGIVALSKQIDVELRALLDDTQAAPDAIDRMTDELAARRTLEQDRGTA